MTTSPQYLSGSHEPPTFKVRGLVAPFTTPILSSARVRRSERIGIELITPNLAGGKGVYVLQWSGVRALSTPTVHDTLLFQRLGCLTDLAPRWVREATLAAALQGHAGRAALNAARKIVTTDHAQRVQADSLLLKSLVGQAEPNSLMNATMRTPDFDRHVSTVLQRLAPSLRRPVPQLATALAAISGAFAPIGIAQHDTTARVPRLIERLETTCSALSGWAKTDADQELGGLAMAVAASISTAAKWCRAIVASSRALFEDPLALLKRHLADPDGVMALAERADWLLDGWERVCLLWQVPCSVTTRNAALLEMTQCLPILPREAFNWSNPAVPLQAPDQSCRVVSTDGRWRTGSAAFVMIERNEKLRAMSF